MDTYSSRGMGGCGDSGTVAGGDRVWDYQCDKRLEVKGVLCVG